MHKKLLVALSAVGILTLAGCGESKPSYPDLNPPLSGDYVADFSQGESEEVFASDGWSNGQPFNAVWKKENISYSLQQKKAFQNFNLKFMICLSKSI